MATLGCCAEPAMPVCHGRVRPALSCCSKRTWVGSKEGNDVVVDDVILVHSSINSLSEDMKLCSVLECKPTPYRQTSPAPPVGLQNAAVMSTSPYSDLAISIGKVVATGHVAIVDVVAPTVGIVGGAEGSILVTHRDGRFGFLLSSAGG